MSPWNLELFIGGLAKFKKKMVDFFTIAHTDFMELQTSRSPFHAWDLSDDL